MSVNHEDQKLKKTFGSNLMPLYFALVLTIGIGLGKYWDFSGLSKPFASQSKLEQVMELVSDQYVDTLNQTELEDKAINKYLHSFDPHSTYIAARDVAAANQDLKGSFDGVGIEFFLHNDTPYVARVIENGPAMKAGVLPSDRILSADDTSLLGKNNKEIISFLKGKRQSTVRVQIWRNATGELLSKDIQRGKVKLKTVQTSLLDDSTVYFKVAHFANPTLDQFNEGLKKYQKDNSLSRIIIDLRGNPGGYLQVAVELLDEFIDSQELLAYTLGKGENRKSYNATIGGSCKDLELICLVNRYSASASEIFSGAIQDLDRGIVIGERTYGKGLVQETFHLQDASQVRLTVSRYYIPSKRSIQKPYGENGYTGDTSISPQKFRTKNGRKVAAGGGVEPDVMLEESITADRKDYINQHIRFVDANFNLIIGLKTVSDFWKSESILEKINLIPNFTEDDKQALKAELAYQFYGDDAWIFEPSRNAYLQEAMNYFDKKAVLLNP